MKKIQGKVWACDEQGGTPPCKSPDSGKVWACKEQGGSPPCRSPNSGKVWLVGAGPGDVELLTLKAVRALGQADVALVDDLVNREVLQFLRPGARVIEVGKRGGCKSTPQAFIERQMVKLAQDGHVVARIKGGDPFVFGRGGEEVETLRAAGVAVEVVSGITAGIGAPAAMGIPVTHRDCSRGVTLVTGHAAEGPLAPLRTPARAARAAAGRDGAGPDWQALARTGTTLVIYMGMKHLATIARELQVGGLPASTPVALIQNGTLPDERRLVSTLANVAADAAADGIGSPAIVVVGDVVRYAREAMITMPIRQYA